MPRLVPYESYMMLPSAQNICRVLLLQALRHQLVKSVDSLRVKSVIRHLGLKTFPGILQRDTLRWLQRRRHETSQCIDVRTVATLRLRSVILINIGREISVGRRRNKSSKKRRKKRKSREKALKEKKKEIERQVDNVCKG